MDDLHELLATGACARIGGGDDAHSSRTSRSSRLARAQEARITARLHGRRPAGSAREQHGSQLVSRGCAFATCAIPDLIQNAQLARNFPGEENTLTSSKCVYCKEEAASIGSSGLCKSEGRHCTELHPSIFIFFDRGYNFHRNMGGSAKWKMHKIRSQRIRGSRVSSQRIHGSRLDLDRMIRISGNLPPHLQSRSRSAGTYAR